MRFPLIATIFALVWTVSVTMPACERGKRDRLMTEVVDGHRGQRAGDALRPTEISMSISRGSGSGRSCGPARPAASVVSPIAREHPDDAVSGSQVATIRSATRFNFSGSPTVGSAETSLPPCRGAARCREGGDGSR